jgi:hypothetical protein
LEKKKKKKTNNKNGRDPSPSRYSRAIGTRSNPGEILYPPRSALRAVGGVRGKESTRDFHDRKEKGIRREKSERYIRFHAVKRDGGRKTNDPQSPEQKKKRRRKVVNFNDNRKKEEEVEGGGGWRAQNDARTRSKKINK